MRFVRGFVLGEYGGFLTHSTKTHQNPTIFRHLKPLDFGSGTPLYYVVNPPYIFGKIVFTHQPTSSAVGFLTHDFPGPDPPYPEG